jgi:hypothetical protein
VIRRRRFGGARVAAAATVAAMIAVACSGDTEDPSSGGTAGGGPLTACDRIGRCGDASDPMASCQQCAITEGSCAEAYRVCNEDPTGACPALNGCYLDCPQGDEGCYAGCDEAIPAGVAPFQALVDCVFCVECTESCNVDRNGCG